MNNGTPITDLREQPAVLLTNYGDDAQLDELVNPDLAELITILFAEQLGGFERMQGDDGVLRWKRQPDPENGFHQEPRTLEELPPVANTGFKLCGFIDSFCSQVNELAARNGSEDRLCWSIQRTGRPHPVPGNAVYSCTFAEAIGGSVIPGKAVYTDDPGLAMAQALLYAKGVNFYAAHRQLFPQRYLVLEGSA